MTTSNADLSSAVAPVVPAPQGAGTTGRTGTVQGAARIHAALEKVTHPERVNPVVIGAGIVAWIGFSAVTRLVPTNENLDLRDITAIQSANAFAEILGLVIAALAALLWALSPTGGRFGAWARHRVAIGAAWLLGSGLWFLFWELTTAKWDVFKPPYLAAPQAILQRLWEFRRILAESAGNSLLLLLVGVLCGVVTGLITGLAIGWYQTANYWVHPILMIIGPVPSLAWVPLAFVLLPSAYAAAVFMIALTVWFPITLLTRAGIAGVPRSYFDVAQTLGAKTWFLVLRVSLPAALPSIFTGAFMALGGAFVSLTVAENFGVSSGLGWYLNWQKGWGDYPAVYAGIIVLVVFCDVLLTLLLRSRRWVLRWEKELTRW